MERRRLPSTSRPRSRAAGSRPSSSTSTRKALELEPKLSGAHYGLAFLLLKRGDGDGAIEHLEAFLRQPPSGGEADRWVRHAQQTLDDLRSGTEPGAAHEMTEP